MSEQWHNTFLFHERNKQKNTSVKNIIQSITFYSSELWHVTKAIKNKLMRKLGNGLFKKNKFWFVRVRNEQIRNKTEKYQNENEEIEKKTLYMVRKEKRRLRKSWCDDIKETIRARHLEKALTYDKRSWELEIERWHQP